MVFVVKKVKRVVLMQRLRKSMILFPTAIAQKQMRLVHSITEEIQLLLPRATLTVNKKLLFINQKNSIYTSRYCLTIKSLELSLAHGMSIIKEKYHFLRHYNLVSHASQLSFFKE